MLNFDFVTGVLKQIRYNHSVEKVYNTHRLDYGMWQTRMLRESDMPEYVIL